MNKPRFGAEFLVDVEPEVRGAYTKWFDYRTGLVYYDDVPVGELG